MSNTQFFMVFALAVLAPLECRREAKSNECMLHGLKARMASGGMGNRLGLLFSHAAVAESLNQTLYVMWNVTDDGRLPGEPAGGRLLPHQKLGHCWHGCYSYGTFRRFISLPSAVKFVDDMGANDTAALFESVARTEIPGPYTLPDSILSVDGDHLPGPWWTRMKRVAWEGLFVPIWGGVSLQQYNRAYAKVQQEFQPSAEFQNVCHLPDEAYQVFHARCSDGGADVAHCDMQVMTNMLKSAVPASQLPWIVLSNDQSVLQSLLDLIRSMGGRVLLPKCKFLDGEDENTIQALHAFFLIKSSLRVFASSLIPSTFSIVPASAGGACYATSTDDYFHCISENLM